ncbi:MAG: hypothetical protein WKF89_06305 [Chitinophagaceae bacterium]
MKKSMVTLAVSITCLAFAADAQTQNAARNHRKWGIEADLVAPFLPEVGIITFKATRTISKNKGKTMHGDLLLGLYLRPNVKHDIVQKIN